MVYIIQKTPFIGIETGVCRLNHRASLSPPSWEVAKGGIPSLRIARRVPPTPGDSFTPETIFPPDGYQIGKVD
jgi:hypothetical protein